jgi:Predicted endonuclease containing a URI domain
MKNKISDLTGTRNSLQVSDEISTEGATGHFAYMLQCVDGTIYSGYSTDPNRRVAIHNSGRGAKYTRSRLPVKLVFIECFPTKGEALKREAALKKLSRSEKLALISSGSMTFNERT